MTYPTYTRADWASRRPAFGRLNLPVRKVFAHHTAGPYMPTFDVDAMRRAEESEIARGGYVALAYHELFPGDGSQVESRPVACMGGATINNNSVSIAVCLPGNYALPGALVSWAQAGSCQEWLSALVFGGVLTADFELLPHKAVFATACPGVFNDHLAAIRAGVAGPGPVGPPLPTPPAQTPDQDAQAFLSHLSEAVTATRRFLMLGFVVSKGSHNDAAWTVQLACNAAGQHLVVDSDFGSKTEQAVRAYQAAHGLNPDGVVGRLTYASMYPG